MQTGEIHYRLGQYLMLLHRFGRRGCRLRLLLHLGRCWGRRWSRGYRSCHWLTGTGIDLQPVDRRQRSVEGGLLLLAQSGGGVDGRRRNLIRSRQGTDSGHIQLAGLQQGLPGCRRRVGLNALAGRLVAALLEARRILFGLVGLQAGLTGRLLAGELCLAGTRFALLLPRCRLSWRASASRRRCSACAALCWPAASASPCSCSLRC